MRPIGSALQIVISCDVQGVCVFKGGLGALRDKCRGGLIGMREWELFSPTKT
jgi:hypothetical protein